MGNDISPLLTDFYELTMIGGYFRNGRHEMEVVFEYYFRNLPGECGFGLFAGLEDFTQRFGAERLIFGTGLPEFAGSGCVAQLLYAEIDDAQKQLIAGGNLKRIMGGIKDGK